MRETISIVIQGKSYIGYRVFNKRAPYYQTVYYKGKSSYDGFGYSKDQINGSMLAVSKQILYSLAIGFHNK
tara:strand:+ start:507 stop:719 length:213 start_codon:yes stop_codon:yes gene_type:complete